MSIYDFGVGGYDIVYTAPDLSNGQYIRVSSAAGITALDVATPATARTYVDLGKASGLYYVSVRDKDLGEVDRYTSDLAHLGEVRIVFHNEFITIYVQDYWVHTFWFDDIYHPEDQAVKMSASGSIAVTDIRLKELSDWREAIFVDMETNSQNAISSVILQRPIEIRSAYGGEMVFVYDPVRETQILRFAKSLEIEHSESTQGCSDAIVYFTNAAVVVDDSYAEQVGFVTRMYRFPDLDNGAIKAAKIQQRIARQARTTYRVVCRFHPNVEVGDIVSIAFPASGSNLAVDIDLIVESLNFSIENGVQVMTLVGRDAELGSMITPATPDVSVQYDWYVNSVNGSDDYEGTTAARPFATIAKMLTVLQMGDSVGLARDSVWREKFDVLTKSGVVASAYGVGEPPLLDCSDVAANTSFTKTGGQTNVYEISVTVDYLASEPMWNSIWEDDVRLVRASSVANCDATPGSMYASNDNNASVTLYVHASNSSNVITNGKTYEYAKWLSGFYSYFASNCGLSGVNSRRNLSNGGSIKVGRSSIVYDCTAEDGNSHNFYCRTGSWIEKVICHNFYYTGASTSMFVYNEDSPNSEGITFVECEANLDTFSSITGGFFGHTNVSGNFGTIVYDRCKATNMSAAFQGRDATFSITGSEAIGCSNGIWVVASSTWSIDQFSFSGGTDNCRAIVSQGNDVTIDVARSSLDVSVNGGIAIMLASYNNPTLVVSNTTLLGKSGQTVAIRHTGTGGTIVVERCEFDTHYRPYQTNSGSATVTSDYNRFVQDMPTLIQGTAYANIAAYRAATGQDPHSTVG